MRRYGSRREPMLKTKLGLMDGAPLNIREPFNQGPIQCGADAVSDFARRPAGEARQPAAFC
jgi:hypothetical protein